jgi:hypothetical protein
VNCDWFIKDSTQKTVLPKMWLIWQPCSLLASSYFVLLKHSISASRATN